jgi:origin recognition complex subunit 2
MDSTDSPRRSKRNVSFKGKYSELADVQSNSEKSDHEFSEPDEPATPSKKRSVAGKSPSKRRQFGSIRTPRKAEDLNRSARKRATKVLLQTGDEELDEEDALLAERIIQESRDEGRDDSQYSPGRFTLDDDEQGSQALFLDGPEGYFDQHKSREKISTTPFTKAPSIEYHEFVQYVRESASLNKESRTFLISLYKTMFPQWHFELTQGFSLVFYGIGSKRNLLMNFVTSTIDPEIPTLVVNGYNSATTFKEILNAAVPVIVPDQSERQKFPLNPPDLLAAVLKHMENEEDTSVRLVLVIHNIDGDSLRSDRNQALLAGLCSIKQIWLVCSVDHINGPVLWDAAKLSQYNFLWHDLTTYELYSTETTFEDPLGLGRSRQAVGSKGVKYVLASLTANARSLYKLLIFHQIEVMTEELAPDDTSTVGTAAHGIEFKLFYKKCVEEFIVSNELNFRTMLSEFKEHKMAQSAKDQSGAEKIFVPFTKDAIETILEELTDM